MDKVVSVAFDFLDMGLDASERKGKIYEEFVEHFEDYIGPKHKLQPLRNGEKGEIEYILWWKRALGGKFPVKFINETHEYFLNNTIYNEGFTRNVYRRVLEYCEWLDAPLEESKLPSQIKFPKRLRIFQEFHDIKERREILDEEMGKRFPTGLKDIPGEYIKGKFGRKKSKKKSR